MKNKNEKYYIIDGKEVPRVTHILDIIDKGFAFRNWLIANTKAEIEDIQKVSLNIGSKVHKWIEAYIKRVLLDQKKFEHPNVSEKYLKPIMAFLEWEHNHNVKYLESELFLYSKTYNYAGTCDLIAEVDGERWLIDFKTSKYFYDTMGLQLAFYKKAYEETYTKKINKTFILRLDKETGKPYFKEYNDKFRTCLAVLEIWNWRNKKNKGGE